MSSPLEPLIASYARDVKAKQTFALVFGIKVPILFGAIKTINHAQRHLEAMCGGAAMLGGAYLWVTDYPDNVESMFPTFSNWNRDTRYTFGTSDKMAYDYFSLIFNEASKRLWLEDEDKYIINAGSMLSDLVLQNIRNDPNLETKGLYSDIERLEFACQMLAKACVG